MLKFVLLLFVTLGINGNLLVKASQKTDIHNAIWGARTSSDVLIKREVVKKLFKPLRIVAADYEFRQTSERTAYPRTITQIVVTDQYSDGDGGYATLKSGGPGMDFAVIHLKSQRGHGYHFTIDIYGQ
ncbi:probable salivary secreted peptide [Eurosta solidaginis]|uniref:probable salivary secreted peptide n=1 Tax=Eurosta solidaginis TaxID=178769 RepID=UPI00353166D4